MHTYMCGWASPSLQGVCLEQKGGGRKIWLVLLELGHPSSALKHQISWFSGLQTLTRTYVSGPLILGAFTLRLNHPLALPVPHPTDGRQWDFLATTCQPVPVINLI